MREGKSRIESLTALQNILRKLKVISRSFTYRCFRFASIKSGSILNVLNMEHILYVISNLKRITINT